jgi:putative hydrolase of the HAD superfamily
MTSVQAVVFDLYGTLTDPAVESRRGEYDVALAAIVGADPAKWAAAMRASFTPRATGVWGAAPQILRRLCDETGVVVSADVLERAVEARLDHHRRLTVPRPEAGRVLRAVRDRGLRIGVLSDCTPEMETTWPSFELRDLVDVAVFSCDVGRRKPAAVLYEMATARLGTPPSRCLYVGDGSSGELSGARRAGMRAVRIVADHGMHIDEETDWDGPTIASLDELLPMLAPGRLSED